MTDHSDLIERLARESDPQAIAKLICDALSSQSLSLSEAREEIESANKFMAAQLDGTLLIVRQRNEANQRVDEMRQELDAISAAIGSPRFMDPPDGGDVSLADQVRRMRAELEAKEARLAVLENGPAGLADAHSNPPEAEHG